MSTSRSTPRNARPRNNEEGHNGLKRQMRVQPRVARRPQLSELAEDARDDDEDNFLDETGKFAKGHERRGGRKKGQQNKMTKDLKAAIINAACEAGYDGNGLDGLTGYMRMLAKKEPKSFAPLLGRMIPIHMGGSVDVNHRVLKSKEEVREELAKRGLLIEGVYERLEDWTPAQQDKEQ